LSDSQEELLNVYDPEGQVVGQLGREQAKREGAILGAVNLLLLNEAGQVLLQARVPDKENGGSWDKSVGGHVSAGEDFDATVLRETKEELFSAGEGPELHLVHDPRAFRDLLGLGVARREVVLLRRTLQLGLRDVRRLPGGGHRTVLYHVATYVGRTDLPIDAFSPQPSEVVALRYAGSDEVDRLLLDGRLTPNMAFLWLTHAGDLGRWAEVDRQPDFRQDRR
jgi:hypothetical protein